MDRLKYHDQIRIVSSNGHTYIYHSTKTRILHNNRGYTAHQLSVMKQDNISTTLLDPKVSLDDIKEALRHTCGYCFEHPGCIECPLGSCDTPEYDKMRKCKSKHTFAKLHLTWRTKLGLLK